MSTQAVSLTLTPDARQWPPERDAPVVVLALARTSVERGLIDELVNGLRERTGSDDIELTYEVERALELAAPANLPITPVGVAWLPADQESGRSLRTSDLLALGDPLHPNLRQQRRILDRSPDRCRVIIGEAASRAELAARWERHSGSSPDSQDFGRFVLRQARITLDRAERAMLGARYKTARDIVEDLVASRRFRSGAEELAATLGRSPDDVVAEARTALDELASVQQPLARDLWVQMARYLWSRAYYADVDQHSIEQLRELNQRYPLVFLPSHKSNLDGFVMAAVMYDAGFPQNHVIGGKNMGFWPLGMLGRRVGVVWIRRSFSGDAVYKFALRRYLAHLASKRFNLEWYIEGGRSRSGKLLPPRLGLLNYLARGVEEAEVDDVMLVPVSIVYDRLSEVLGMTAELRGAAKRPEGLRWLLGYARQQRHAQGRVQVRFGEPVALRAGLAAAGKQAGGRSLALSKVAFEVCTRINRTTPVTPISLVTLALLGVDGAAVTLEQIERSLRPMVDYVMRRGLPGGESLEPLRGSEGVIRVLGTLTEHGVVEAYGGAESVYRISPERELAAAFYRNVVIHWFVSRSIVELALVAAAESGGQDPMGVALAEALRLRDLLKFEFFFSEKAQFEAELRDEVALIDPAWRAHGGAGLPDLARTLAASGGMLAGRVLRSFVEAYCIVADRLVAHGGAAVTEDEVVGQCLVVGRQYLLQRRIASAEAVSSELFKTGLRLAANRKLLDGEPSALGGDRAALLGELRDVLRRLELLVSWDQKHRLRRESELGPNGVPHPAARPS
ncbi:MAG: glycerol-3-phosphate O-acyltransferase [Solirubrobacteraceae bacterium]|jgi:glycerol-3-phosphate O-acyltransferase|nr:glycerol-3-phosphate O-acyltransferase [Solirubrobacteraceae bacterium]